MLTFRLFALLPLLGILASCEGAIDFQGHTYDSTTGRSIAGVQVIMVLDDNDTIWKCKPPVPNDFDAEKYQQAFTDTDGHFSISSGLVDVGPGELRSTLVFIKNGYAPVSITNCGHTKIDSVLMRPLQ